VLIKHGRSLVYLLQNVNFHLFFHFLFIYFVLLLYRDYKPQILARRPFEIIAVRSVELIASCKKIVTALKFSTVLRFILIVIHLLMR